MVLPSIPFFHRKYTHACIHTYTHAYIRPYTHIYIDMHIRESQIRAISQFQAAEKKFFLCIFRNSCRASHGCCLGLGKVTSINRWCVIQKFVNQDLGLASKPTPVIIMKLVRMYSCGAILIFKESLYHWWPDNFIKKSSKV
jgi:hypothetical protein